MSSIQSSPFGGSDVQRRGDSLADVLERVLDKGIVIAGDIRVDLLDIELLTIRIRLLVSSADKAEELGMAWWRNDPFYTGEESTRPTRETDEVLRQLAQSTDELARRVAALEPGSEQAGSSQTKTADDGAHDGQG